LVRAFTIMNLLFQKYFLYFTMSLSEKNFQVALLCE
jgi:hypothetical protein